MGDINVYTGPMKCGKTQKILDEAKRQQIAGKEVKIFKPAIDNRFSEEKVVSRGGFNQKAININSIDEIEKYEADVYVIDEFQFLKGNLDELYKLAKKGKKFFIAGLNLTSERKTFGEMGNLLCMADNVQMLTSVCENCRNEEAIFTYYKGKTKSDDILVGDEDLYIPVCRKCYEKLTGTGV
jgi:thymidine kinase